MRKNQEAILTKLLISHLVIALELLSWSQKMLSFFLYIMPYALADILGMLRCRASKHVNR